MEKRVKKILIAIPTARYIEPETFRSIYNLKIPAEYEVTFQYFYGYRVDQVRNLIADWTVKGFDYLFAVDHDITFAPDTLAKLLSHDKDVISGIYRQRLPEQAIEIFDFNMNRLSIQDIHRPGSGPVRIGGCGFGCVLVKKEVLETIGYPQFEYHVALNHIDTVSEDTDFCRKAAAAGFSIWCDTTILCGHIGSTTMDVELPRPQEEDKIQKRLRELGSMDLLPELHIEMLKTMKVDGIRPKVIYDIGACVLHWTKEANNVWPDAEMILIEAMPEVKFLYEEFVRKNGGNFVVGALLSDKAGETVMFNKNVEHPGGNSMYEENPDYSPLATELFPKENKVLYYTTTIDDLVRDFNLPQPDLIKMDIQGAEYKAILGGLKTIKNTKHLILELQHVEYNIGSPHADEVIEYLDSLGFKMISKVQSNELGVDADYLFENTQWSGI